MASTGTRSTIIAYTSEGDELAAVRERGLKLAKARGATLILYDVDAADPLEGSPLPTNWSADGEDADVPDRLSPQDLEKAGRASIADQVRAARLEGIEAWGWLPDRPDAVADYAARVDAGLILLPETMREHGLLERITGSLAKRAAQIEPPPGVDVEIVRD